MQTDNKSRKGIYGTDTIEFAIFAANLYHLLDIRSKDQQVVLFGEARRYIKRQAETTATDVADTTLDDTYWRHAKPGVIMTFHYGEYRHLPIWMIRQRIPIAVLVSRDVLLQQQDYYQKMFGKTSLLRFIVAEDEKVFFEVKKSLTEGYHILCYADGGTGVQQKGKNIHSMHIDFLKGKLLVRTGFMHMAYLLNCSIYATWTSASGAGFVCTSIFDPRQYAGRAEFVREVTYRVYSAFAIDVDQCPGRWELLCTLQANLVHAGLQKKVSPLARDRYCSVRMGQRYYLLDICTYQCYPIDQKRHQEIAEFLF